jgi:hypothetical protein
VLAGGRLAHPDAPGELAHGANGLVTESIKWKTPTFAYQGNIASFNPSRHLLSIMLHRGAEIPGTHPRLEGDGRLVRTMRFRRPGRARGRPARAGGRRPRLVRLEGRLGQACDWVMLTIQGTPNRSTHMPNSSPHICFSRGMVTVPPSESFSQ